MLKLTVKGDFIKTSRYLDSLRHKKFLNRLMKYADKGTKALAKYTPHDTGYTAQSWYSEIEETDGRITIYWKNTNINDGVPIAIILQYGHGTGTGGYVAGKDYITPAMKPIFDEIAKCIREEVKS